MVKKIKLEFTERQLRALVDVTDTISAMIGCGSDFDDMEKEVMFINRMLKKNGYKRHFK